MPERTRPWRVVLDTNLLVSGFISRTGAPFGLVQQWYERAFTLVVTAELQTEYADVLARPHLIQRFGLNPVEIAAFFEALAIDGELVEALSPVPIEVRDPNDERVLAAALAGRADYLVTGDYDLLVLVGAPRLGDLSIVTARVFLDLIVTRE
jgi:putative PIN family toxin of toxin-antitoxin system